MLFRPAQMVNGNLLILVQPATPAKRLVQDLIVYLPVEAVEAGHQRQIA
jgi:hypothetical protein